MSAAAATPEWLTWSEGTGSAVQLSEATSLWKRGETQQLRQIDLIAMCKSAVASVAERRDFGDSLLSAIESAMPAAPGRGAEHVAALLSASCLFALHRLPVDDEARAAFQHRLLAALHQGVTRLLLGRTVRGAPTEGEASESGGETARADGEPPAATRARRKRGGNRAGDARPGTIDEGRARDVIKRLRASQTLYQAVRLPGDFDF